MSLETARIRIVGFGYVGQSCLRELQRLGCQGLIVVERRLRTTYPPRQGVLYTNSSDVIRGGDWVIFVAGAGDQVDVARFPRIFGINDMYPPFSPEQMQSFAARGSTMHEVALRAEGVQSSLPIEQFGIDQFPGCMSQGLVEAAGVDTSQMQQPEFNVVAWNLGIRSGIHSS